MNLQYCETAYFKFRETRNLNKIILNFAKINGKFLRNSLQNFAKHETKNLRKCQNKCIEYIVPYSPGVFIIFGLSGIAPATHYSIVNGWEKSVNEAAIGWLILMGRLSTNPSSSYIAVPPLAGLFSWVGC